METPGKRLFSVIEVTVQRRTAEELGVYFYAYSPHVPGLHLTSTDLESLAKDVVLGIKRLYKVNKGLDVELEFSSEPESFPARPAGLVADGNRTNHLVMMAACA